MWRNFKVMPCLLQLLSAHALACFSFAILAVVPNEILRVGGRVVPYGELWSTGLGVYVVTLGTLAPLSGILMLRRSNRARGTYICTLAFAFFGGGLFIDLDRTTLVFYLAMLGVIAGYLYFSKAVNCYFSSN